MPPSALTTTGSLVSTTHGVKRQNCGPANKRYDGNDVEEHIHGRAYKYEQHESAPSLPIFHEDFGHLDTLFEFAVLKLWNTIQSQGTSSDEPQPSISMRDDHLDCLAKQLIKMTSVDYGAITSIALEGDTSTGKSFLLNNLLGKRNLAKSGDFGKSCTQVMTSYAGNKADGPPFQAHIHWRSKKSIGGNIRTHLQNYVQYHTQEKASVEDHVTDENEDPINECFEQKGTAVEFFQTLFCDQPEFESEDAMESFLLNTSVNDEEHLVRLLVKNVQDIFNACNANEENISKIQADNLGELHSKLRPYVERKNNSVTEPRYWPFVDEVKIYLDSPILKVGMELVDYPGGTDTNTIRKDASMRYLEHRCSAVIITSNIGRAATSPSILRSLTRAVSTKGANNVVLALTKGDVCDSDPHDLTICEAADFANLSCDVETAKDAIFEAQERDDADAEEEANQALEKAQRNQERKRIIVRNQKLIPEIQDKYKTLTEPFLVQVTPVANNEYAKHMRAITKRSPPILGVHETGIPPLRHTMCKIVNERKMASIDKHHASLKLVSDRILLWTEKSRLDRKADVEALISEPISRCGNMLDGLADGAMLTFAQLFTKSFGNKLKRTWGPMLTGRVSIWGAQYNATSFKAFLTRYGYHQPRNGDLMSMSTQLVQTIEPDVWALHCESLKFVEDVTILVNQRFGDMIGSIEQSFTSCKHLAGIDMRVFMGVFNQEKTQIYNDLKVAIDDLIQNLRAIIVKALDTSQPTMSSTAFLARMHDIYLDCNACAAGKGAHAKRVNRLSAFVTANTVNGPFVLMANEITNQVKKQIAQCQRNLTACIREGLMRILADIDIRFGGKEMDAEARNKLREQLLLVMPEFRHIMDDSIPNTIEQCKKFC